ncbi:Dihydrolipoamide acyltransferase [Frankia canadensis]|uniref:Dihydrolipoamide acyltransferase n=1 Tax=Frankia canadensis TaxID=1836972 RepID=A0A2I2L2S9_9ACTN|nr:lipoyl domain-containing protein [Frankia canadensis]SNQ52222.1 Dihydrolipoamide acyltransferase [Frankia canadensis]SOU59512.1 Dihydrolipoamide acyltransferase [Frankia canadensis]
MNLRITVKMPKLAVSMQDGTLSEWLVADGSEVKEGEPLYVVETDKAAQEVPSPATGTIRLIATTGEDYDVGAPIAEIIFTA